ncbi:MAG: YdcF family protein, partial [Oscillospiraceae bacterium]|nr:YdcF family protein [Oscillospiraceae bacterium]
MATNFELCRVSSFWRKSTSWRKYLRQICAKKAGPQLSGGQGADECVSEAECMRRWLAEQGVPAEQMLLEDRSTDTAENMAFS